MCVCVCVCVCVCSLGLIWTLLLNTHEHTHTHTYSYLNNAWLANMDWSVKKFRGKAIKNKNKMEDLLMQIKAHYKKEQVESDGGKVGEKEKGEEEEKELWWLISAKEPVNARGRVHMPGYPE